MRGPSWDWGCVPCPLADHAFMALRGALGDAQRGIKMQALAALAGGCRLWVRVWVWV